MLKSLAFYNKCIFICIYCLCFVNEISTDMLEEHVLEERNPDLNEDEDIIMEDSRAEHWRDFDKDGEDNSNIHAPRWDIYTRDKEYLTKREFSLSDLHTKGVFLFFNCVKDNITEEKEQYDYIGLHGFAYK